jgi:cytidine deaminase
MLLFVAAPGFDGVLHRRFTTVSSVRGTDQVLTEADHELIAAATSAVDAHSDDYFHTVAASVRDSNGTVFTGLNVFHFTGGPCAELVALGTARTAGARELRTIVAVGHGGRGVLAPCGRCRQVLVDLHGDIRVIVSADGGLASVAASDLLPFRYTAPGA